MSVTIIKMQAKSVRIVQAKESEIFLVSEETSSIETINGELQLSIIYDTDVPPILGCHLRDIQISYEKGTLSLLNGDIVAFDFRDNSSDEDENVDLELIFTLSTRKEFELGFNILETKEGEKYNIPLRVTEDLDAINIWVYLKWLINFNDKDAGVTGLDLFEVQKSNFMERLESGDYYEQDFSSLYGENYVELFKKTPFVAAVLSDDKYIDYLKDPENVSSLKTDPANSSVSNKHLKVVSDIPGVTGEAINYKKTSRDFIIGPTDYSELHKTLSKLNTIEALFIGFIIGGLGMVFIQESLINPFFPELHHLIQFALEIVFVGCLGMLIFSNTFWVNLNPVKLLNNFIMKDIILKDDNTGSDRNMPRDEWSHLRFKVFWSLDEAEHKAFHNLTSKCIKLTYGVLIVSALCLFIFVW